MRKKLLCTALCLLLLFTAGCLKNMSLDEYCYVLDIGVERGERLPYNFVFLLNQDTGSSESSSEGKGELTVISAEARSIYEAIETLSASLTTRLSFEKATLLAFTRELAEKGEILSLTDLALGKLKIRQNIRIIIVENDMKAVFQGLISKEDPSMSRLKSNVKSYEALSGLIQDCALNKLSEAFDSDVYDVLAPYCGVNQQQLFSDMAGGQEYPYVGGALMTEGQLKTSISGTAVFSGDKMVGILSGQHTMLVMMAAGTFRQGRYRLPWKDDRELSITLYALKTPKVALKGETATYSITLEADVEMPEIIKDATSEEMASYIEEALQEDMERVYLAVRNAGADVFGLGKEAVKQFSSNEAWEAYDFKTVYRTIEAVFHIKIKLSHDPDNITLE